VSEHPEIEPAAEAPSSASLREAPSPTRGEGDPGFPEPTPESLAPIAPLSPRGRGAGGEGAEAFPRVDVEDDKAEAPPGAVVEDKAQSAPIAPLSPRGRGAGGEGAEASLRAEVEDDKAEAPPGAVVEDKAESAPIAPLSPRGRRAGGEGAEASPRAEVEDDKAEAPPRAVVEDKAGSVPIAPLSPRGRGAGGEGAAPPAVVTRSDKTHRLRERRNRGFAKAMRRNPTEAEQKLWLILKDRRFSGFKFRRQVPIGPFIADFVCYSRRLIVELDGSQHAGSAADEHRAATLAEKGFATIRVWNSDLTANPDGVADAIWHQLEERAHG